MPEEDNGYVMMGRKENLRSKKRKKDLRAVELNRLSIPDVDCASQKETRICLNLRGVPQHDLPRDDLGVASGSASGFAQGSLEPEGPYHQRLSLPVAEHPPLGQRG